MNSKTFLLAAVFGMVAYLTQAVIPFLGRSVPLGIVCAILFGACFPKSAALAALAMTFYVITLPSRSAATRH